MSLEQSDLDQIQEMISGVTEALTQKFGENTEALRQEFGQQIGGVKKWAKTAIASSSTEFEKKVAEAIAIEPEKDTTESLSVDNKTVEQSDNRLDQLFQQVKAQKQMVESLRTDLQKSESARVQSEESARKIAAKSEFVSKIRDKTVDPDTFVSVLESKGVVFEQDGKYLTKTGKTTTEGTDEVINAETLIDDLLSKEYSYFSKPRQGTGAGTQPGGESSFKTKSFVKDDSTADDLFDQMEKGNLEGILNDLT